MNNSFGPPNGLLMAMPPPGLAVYVTPPGTKADRPVLRISEEDELI